MPWKWLLLHLINYLQYFTRSLYLHLWSVSVQDYICLALFSYYCSRLDQKLKYTFRALAICCILERINRQLNEVFFVGCFLKMCLCASLPENCAGVIPTSHFFITDSRKLRSLVLEWPSAAQCFCHLLWESFASFEKPHGNLINLFARNGA